MIDDIHDIVVNNALIDEKPQAVNKPNIYINFPSF